MTDTIDLTFEPPATTPGRRLNNWTATVPPTVHDDEGAAGTTEPGYSVGSRWFDVVALVAWECIDPALGNAQWHIVNHRWSGLWTAVRAYTAGEIVRDGEYLGIANKTTTERLAPTRIGDPEWSMSDTPAWTEHAATFSQIVAGVRFTSQTDAFVSGIRFHPDLLPDTNLAYTVATVRDPLGANPVMTIYADSLIVTESGWYELPGLGEVIVQDGATFDVILQITNRATEVTTLAEYDYQTPNNQAVPTSGEAIHANKGIGYIRFHKTDDNGTDRAAMLLGLNPGDLITSGTFNWEVAAAPTDEGTYVEVDITPAVQASPDGVYEFTFTQYTALPAKYVELLGHWSGNPYIAGLAGATYEGIAEVDDAYGIDLLHVDAFISDDWDYMAVAGGSGGGGGGETGPAGPPGSQWYTGTGAPSDTLGIDGDWYLDGDDGMVWEKSGGTWLETSTDLTGPQGPQGDKGDTGDTGPPGTTLHDGLTDVTPDQHHPRLHDHSDDLDGAHPNPKSMADGTNNDLVALTGGAQFDDLVMPNIGTMAAFLFYGHTQDVTITGIDHTGARVGQLITLFNAEPYSITLKFRDSASLPDNSFYTPNLADYIIGPWGTAQMGLSLGGSGYDWIIRGNAGRQTSHQQPVTQAFGDTPDNAPTDPTWSAGLHRHGMPADPVPGHESTYDHTQIGQPADHEHTGADDGGGDIKPDTVVAGGTPPAGISATSIVEGLYDGDVGGAAAIWGIADNWQAPGLFYYKAKGTPAAPLAVVAGDLHYNFAMGWDGAGWAFAAGFGSHIEGTVVSGAGTIPAAAVLMSFDDAGYQHIAHYRFGTFMPLEADDAMGDLGAVDARWRNAYFSGTVYAPTFAALTGATTFADWRNESGGAWRPLATNAAPDIGSVSYPARSGYFSGTVNFAGGTVTGAIVPSGNATIASGGPAARWSNVYTAVVESSGWLTLATGSKLLFNVGGATEANLNTIAFYPESDGGLDLGGPAPNRFKDGYFSGTVIAPVIGATASSMTIRANPNLYFHVAGADWALGTATYFAPVAAKDAAIDFGRAAQRWKDGHFSGTVYAPEVEAPGNLLLRANATAADTLRWDGTRLRPNTAGASLGQSTYEWGDGYFSGAVNVPYLSGVAQVNGISTGHLYISANASYQLYLGGQYIRFSALVLPDADATRSLGSASFRFIDGHFSGSVHAPAIRHDGELALVSASRTVIYPSGAALPYGFDANAFYIQGGGANIGDSGWKFKDGYFSGTVNVPKVAAGTSFLVLDGDTEVHGSINGTVKHVLNNTQLRPATAADATINLGASYARYKDAHFSSVVYTPTVKSAAAANLSFDGTAGAMLFKLAASTIAYLYPTWFGPAADSTVDLGRTAYRFKDAYFSGSVYGRNFYGDADYAMVVRAATGRSLVLGADGANQLTLIGSTFRPSASGGSHALGSSSFPYSKCYATDFYGTINPPVVMATSVEDDIDTFVNAASPTLAETQDALRGVIARQDAILGVTR